MKEKYLTDFQKEIIDSDNKITICNWSRGLGKTYTCARIITDNKPRYIIYYYKYRNDLRILGDKLREIMHLDKQINDSIQSLSIYKDFINIKYNSGEETTVITLKNAVSLPQYKQIEYDYILFDESLPFNTDKIKSKKIMSFITINNRRFLSILPNSYKYSIHGLKDGIDNDLYNKQAIIEKRQNLKDTYGNLEIFNNEFDILNEYDQIFKENKLSDNSIMNFKDSLLPILKDLLSEYMAIKPEKNNVMTRQNILKMITDLYQVIYDGDKVTVNDVLKDISHVWDSKKDFNILNPINNGIVYLAYMQKITADNGNAIGDSLKSIMDKLDNKE